MNEIRWHYTVGARLRDICAEGVIRPATVGVPEGEIPVVWFTESSDWEPTSNKMWQDSPGSPLRLLNRAETARLGGGLVRIGVLPASAPHSYRNFAKITKATTATERNLTRAARSKGALVGLWYFSAEPVSDNTWVAIEGYDDATGWRSIADRRPD